ncbi:MAG: dienelactone hydrolase, partial [Solirubrobacterales bacterium]|nr:dienelactone hydrolase [Solirubrobacterales bacterium]
MQPYIDRLDERGIEAFALRLPRGAVERATRSLREQVGAELAVAVIGGHSYGGRVASMVAAETSPAGLVLLSYPLHRPGHPDELR